MGADARSIAAAVSTMRRWRRPWRDLAVSLSLCALASVPAHALAPIAPAVDFPLEKASGQRTVVLAGGCFWGMQAVYKHVKGVTKVTAGYTGGAASTANYKDVSTHFSEHVEAVQVIYDPSKITLGTLLQVFFFVAHDPTQVDRQGPDVGKQYRSEVFFSNPGQKQVESDYISQLNQARVFDGPIATEVKSARKFYRAEGFHQNYVEHHPDSRYVIYTDLPKITHLQILFPKIYKDGSY